MLNRALNDRQQRLARVRLTPALVERPLAAATDKLASLARIASQLHPEKPLERGYAIVRDPAGKALTGKAQAAKEKALTLQFKDGDLGVGVGDAPPPVQAQPAKTPRKSPPKRKPNPRQDDLFG